MYCKEKEAQFIRTLPGYKLECWSELTDNLLSYYPAEDKDKVYHTKDLRNFIDWERKIKRHSDFDKYCQKFRIIALSLEERSHLTKVEKDDYFFHGLKPKSFHTDMKDELRAQELWMALSNPPRMEHIVTVVEALLRHNLYYDDQSDNDSDPDPEDKNQSEAKSDLSPDDSDEVLDSDQSNIEDSETTSHR